jgi:putative flippase GtrA
MIITNPRERTRFIRFAVVGTVGALVDYSVLNLLTLIFHINVVPASIVSFSTAVISNFLWNRLWTYPDSRSKTMTQQLIQFAIISVAGLAIRTPLIAWTEPLFSRIFTSLASLLSLPSSVIGQNLALSLAIVVVMFWNFFANRYWTYSDVK